MNMKKLGLAALGVAASLGIAIGPMRAGAEQRYWVTDVGTAGGDYAYLRALNDSGQVIGNTTAGPFLYSNGVMTVLVPPGSAGGGEAWDINAAGTVIGNSGYDFYYANGVYSDLSALGGVSTPGAVNNAGQVPGNLGVWQNGVVSPRPSPGAQINNKGQVLGALAYPNPSYMYLMSPDGTVTDLAPLRWSGNVMDPRHRFLNDNGMVVGAYSSPLPDGTFENRLGYWWSGSIFDIGGNLLPGSAPLSDDVRGMNANNDVFGNSWANINHGFLFTYANQKLVDVGNLGGATCLHGINERGDVTGHSSGPGDRPYYGKYVSHGAGAHVVYTGGKLYDLNAVIPASTAYDLAEWQGAINNKGQILAQGWTMNGAEHVLLLTPLPVSTAAVTSGTKRADGWYTTNVTVTITSQDQVSGVREVRYRVDNGSEARVTGSTARVTVNKNGTHTVSFYAIDTKGHVEDTKTFDVSLAKPGLVVTTASLPLATTGVSYTTTLKAAGGGSYSWSAVTPLPSGLTLASNGTLSGTPKTPAISRFLVQVKSGTSTAQAYLALDVTDPLVPTGLSTTAVQRYPISLFAKGGREPYTWSVDPASLPTTVALEGAALFGPLPVGQAVTVTVTDARGVSVTKALTLAQYAPVVAALSSGATTVAVNQPISLAFTASGGKPGSAYTYAWDPNPWPNNPGGLTLDRKTGVVSGAIATTGTYAITLMAQDEDGNVSDGAVVTLTVQ
jgi:hypothetical protein